MELRAVDDRHRAAVRRRSSTRSSTSTRAIRSTSPDPRARRLDLPARRLEVHARTSGAGHPHGLEAGGRLQRLRHLDRLQRGDDPLHPRARLADPSDAGQRPGSRGRAATTGRPSTARPTSSSRRCSATSTRTAGSTSGTSRTPTCAQRDHLLRELAPRDARPARLLHRQPGRLRRLRRQPVGLTASRRSGSATRAHGAPPPQNDNGTITPTAIGQLDPVRARGRRSRRSATLYDTYSAQLWGPYGFRDAFNLDAELVGTRRSSASTRARSSS